MHNSSTSAGGQVSHLLLFLKVYLTFVAECHISCKFYAFLCCLQSFYFFCEPVQSGKAPTASNVQFVMQRCWVAASQSKFNVLQTFL
jgi:hypothetical protein